MTQPFIRSTKQHQCGRLHNRKRELEETGELYMTLFEGHFFHFKWRHRLPHTSSHPIVINNSTKTLFLNLIAYEMSSDAPHDFISYLLFLDSLINHADDVKELEYAGVLQNYLGTHQQVADFFNLESNSHAYKHVRIKIWMHFASHYHSRQTKWMTQCLDTYFGSPWTIIAWVCAALALFFTAVQTNFAIFRP